MTLNTVDLLLELMDGVRLIKEKIETERSRYIDAQMKN